MINNEYYGLTIQEYTIRKFGKKMLEKVIKSKLKKELEVVETERKERRG